jgi:hypothetical protein
MYRMGWLHLLFLLLYSVPAIVILSLTAGYRVEWALWVQAVAGFGTMLPGMVIAPFLAYKVDAWLLDREFRRRYPAA